MNYIKRDIEDKILAVSKEYACSSPDRGRWEKPPFCSGWQKKTGSM